MLSSKYVWCKEQLFSFLFILISVLVSANKSSICGCSHKQSSKDSNVCYNHILKIRYANLELRLVLSLFCMDELSNHGSDFPLVLCSLLLIRPYSKAKSRQRWAALLTGDLLASVALARTERISSTSLSISFSARFLSACIRFIVMTAPR